MTSKRTSARLPANATAPLLERHGLGLKLSVLRDSSLSLVKNPIMERGDRFGLTRLNDTFNTLERHLKLAAG